MRNASKQRALRLIKKAGIARPRDLEAEGVTRALLSRLVKEGLALRQGRGIYVAARHAPSEAHTLARVAKRVPEAVFCIGEHRVEGVVIRAYSAAKTVADCFKYRNKVGIDVAVEALRDFSRKHRGGANELARFSRICRVSRVMQPYLDAIA